MSQPYPKTYLKAQNSIPPGNSNVSTSKWAAAPRAGLEFHSRSFLTVAFCCSLAWGSFCLCMAVSVATMSRYTTTQAEMPRAQKGSPHPQHNSAQPGASQKVWQTGAAPHPVGQVFVTVPRHWPPGTGSNVSMC